jgi:hypothetical protein
MEDKREKFLKIVSNLPDKVRNEDIVIVLNNQPYTWNAAYIEVKNMSETGKKILKSLEALKII